MDKAQRDNHPVKSQLLSMTLSIESLRASKILLEQEHTILRGMVKSASAKRTGTSVNDVDSHDNSTTFQKLLDAANTRAAEQAAKGREEYQARTMEHQAQALLILMHA
ncbi:hypothetical protein BD324DRAFT_614576 [Kockovaella imperatae]|uniref:Uncharacterized protein n=1 Tax=Kockovaella imperatae TaxID=4999 RepID=A0A1Y1UQ34_9TREE|nr:hypothetical protein BD324DRAFT_614576 [Kockovaella imperatae]ORX39677.1 hypothetical protein BD324DRAFT_614576 [Kockovaella imperatae]